MPIFVVILVVFILVLTAWIIIHPNPLFENNWILHSWTGPRVNEFIVNLDKKPLTFALGETRETISLVPFGDVEPMEFILEEISGSEVRSHAERDGLKFTLNYDLVPYERATLTVFHENNKVAELIFVSIGEIIPNK